MRDTKYHPYFSISGSAGNFSARRCVCPRTAVRRLGGREKGCSNTCLKLWSASRNSTRYNNLSRGIRIAPGEVPADQSLRIAATSQQQLSDWLKSINSDVTGWQGGPFIALHGPAGQICHPEPAAGRDLMRELQHNAEREGWRLLEIPLDGSDAWKRDGQLPQEIHAITVAFDSWGAPPLTIWLDGLAITAVGNTEKGKGE